MSQSFDEFWEERRHNFVEGAEIVRSVAREAYRAGQEEMRERAASSPTLKYLDTMAKDIRTLPLEGDDG